jgi:hypothetical protein
VCPQSKFFEKACEDKKWKVGEQIHDGRHVQHQLNPLQEGQDGLIDLKAAEGDFPVVGDDDPRAVKLMVDYLYLDDYDPSTVPAADPFPLAENVKTEESAVEHSVEVTQTDPLPLRSGQWGPTGPTGFGMPSTTAFGTAPGFGGASFVAAQANEPVNTFGGFGSSVPQPKKKKKGKAQPSFLEMHAKVFAIASKYDIKTLEHAAREKFKTQSAGDWSPADLIASIEIVFTHTLKEETELRSALKDAIVRRSITLIQHPEFRAAVDSIEGLVYDLFCLKTQAYG